MITSFREPPNAVSFATSVARAVDVSVPSVARPRSFDGGVAPLSLLIAVWRLLRTPNHYGRLPRGGSACGKRTPRGTVGHVGLTKLQRPAGDRVKTDARDALHLARLLRMDQIVEVRVPSVEQEAARDLVRAREDVRGDLMRCRHRLSKLLLRHGIVYSGGQAWTGVHETWLRGQHFTHRGVQLAFDADLEAMLLTLDRRTRLDKAITEMAGDRRIRRPGAAAVLPARGVHADRVRAGGRGR